MSSMSDSDKKPTLGRRPLGLKTSVEAGEVKQTFSHGRTNKVVVEVKRRKIMPRPGETAAPEAPVVPQAAPAPQPVVRPTPPAPPPSAPAASRETRQELQARLLREAEEARLASAEINNRRELEQRQRATEDARRRVDEARQPEELRDAPEPAPAVATAPEPAAAEPVAAAAETAAAAEPMAQAEADAPVAEDTRAVQTAPRKFTPVAPIKRPEPAAKKPVHAPRDKNANDRRQAGKLTVTRALNEDEGARARSLAALKRAREKERRAHYAGQQHVREKRCAT